MTTGIGGLKLHCEHTSKHHVHCNRYTVLAIEQTETPYEAIKYGTHDWGIVNDEIRCPEHNE